MKIMLCDTNYDVADAWQAACSDMPDVQVHHGSIFQVRCDAVVSPANSFGFMDGGIDRAMTAVLGVHVQGRLQELIQTRHHGELIVGTAEIVPTDHEKIPYLISAPTMRVPMILSETVNVYLATRAALLLIQRGEIEGVLVREIVKTVAFPGMGTGVGRVRPDICARQMRTAIEEVVHEKYQFPSSWADAQKRHQLLYSSTARDLQLRQ